MRKMRRRIAFAMALTLTVMSVPTNGLIGYAEEYPEEIVEEIMDAEESEASEETDMVDDAASTDDVLAEDVISEGLILEEISEVDPDEISAQSFAEGEADDEGEDGDFVINEDSDRDYDVKPHKNKTLIADAVSSTGELFYQWQIGKETAAYEYEYEDIEGATGKTYTVEDITAYAAYQCVISNADQTKSYSQKFYLDLETGLMAHEAQVVRAKIGDSITLKMIASSDYGPLTYQWKKGIYQENEECWGYEDISGETNQTLRVENVQPNLRYACIVSDGYKSRDTLFDINVSRLSVEGEEDTDYIEREILAKKGSGALLTVNAESDYPLQYKWYMQDEEGNNILLPEENSASYETPEVTKTVIYCCEVSDGYNSASVYFTVRIDSGFFVKTEEENEIMLKEGKKAVLTVDAKSDYPLQYKWYEGYDEDAEIVADTSSYETPEITGSCTYRCEVSDGYKSATIYFYIGIDLGFSVAAERYVWVERGSSAELKVSATLDEKYGSLNYTWFECTEDEVGNEDWKQIKGVTGPTCIVNNVTDPRRYRCEVRTPVAGNEVEFVGKDVEFVVGVADEKDEYALDADHAKDFLENAENKAKIPYNYGEAWFRFVPSRSGTWNIHVETDSNRPEVIEIYNAATLDDGWLVCKEDAPDVNVEYSFQAGTVYYLLCHYFDKGTGTFTVKANYTGADAEDHTWDAGTITRTATCESSGVKTYVCTDCGTTYTEEIPALGHDYGEDVTVPATTEKNGERYHICKNCNKKEVLEIYLKESVAAEVKEAKETVAKLEKEDTTAAEIGSAVDAVTKLNNQLMVDLDAVDENSNLTELVATVEKALTGTKDLTGAGIVGTIADSSVAKEDGHVSDGVKAEGAAVTVASLIKKNEIQAQEAATYQAQLKIAENNTSEAGVYKVDISMNILQTVDGNTTAAAENVQPTAPIRITMPVPENYRNAEFKLVHNGTEVPYTMNEDGTTISFYAVSFSPWELQITKCADGKHHYEESVNDPEKKEATHTSAGCNVEICTICGDRELQMVPVIKEHKWCAWTETKQASCSENGKKERHCTVAGCKETEVENTEKLEHDMVLKVDQNATCLTNGSQHRECTVCHTREAEMVIPATGAHTMVTVTDRAVTCGAAGSQHRECTVCHTKETETAIPATGSHQFGAYVVTKQPTVLETGIQTRTCAVCHTTESAEIARLNGVIHLTTKKLPLQVKKNVQLSRILKDLAAGDSIVSCVSSKPKVATVDNSGKVVGKSAGKTNVTITLASGVSDTVTIVVQKKKVAASGISNVSKSLKLKLGEKYILAPVISPITTADKASYRSSNKKVVTVSKKGVITAKKSGTAKITVKAGKKKVTVKVTVEKVAPTGMNKVPESKTLKKGKSFTIKPKLTPSGAEAKITYSSSNKKVATVNAKGKVTAKKKGTATITVKAGNVIRTCVVTVK